jgi:hypothetical protein
MRIYIYRSKIVIEECSNVTLESRGRDIRLLIFLIREPVKARLTSEYYYLNLTTKKLVSKRDYGGHRAQR